MKIWALIEQLKKFDQDLEVALAEDPEGNGFSLCSVLEPTVLERDGVTLEAWYDEYENDSCSCHINPPCEKCVNSRDYTHLVLWP